MTSERPTDDIRRDDAGGVITLTFTRDRKLNAVTGAMLDVIRQAVADLAEDDHLKALVTTAEGRYRHRRGRHHRAARRRDRARRQGQHIPAQLPPAARAVRRDRSGGEADDRGRAGVVPWHRDGALGQLRLPVRRRGATFGLPEVRNIAAMPGSGGISRLTRLIGPHWVKWLAMAGQQLDAQQALAAGYLHAVHPADELEARVREFVLDLIGQPSEALGLAKIVIDAAATADRTAARDFDRVANTALVTSAEHLAKLDEFAARRKRPVSEQNGLPLLPVIEGTVLTDAEVRGLRDDSQG